MRRTEIIIETRKVVVVRRRRNPFPDRCPACGVAAPLLTPAEAARLCGADVREIYRRIEAGAVHFLEVEGGEPLVCYGSLTES